MSRRILLFLISVLVPVVPAHGQDSTDGSVLLEFGWTPGVEATVTYRLFQVEERQSGSADTVRVASTSEMVVTSDGAGLQVDWRAARPLAGQAMSFEALGEPPAMATTWYVSTAGELTDIDTSFDMDDLVEQMIASDASISREDARAVVAEMEAAGLGPDAAVQRGQAELWARYVSLWNGLALELGVEDSGVGEVVAATGDTLLQTEMWGAYKADGCSPHSPGKTCVLLRYGTVTEGPELGAMLRGMVGGLMADDGSGGSDVPAYGDASITNQFSLITEPSTLLPHHLRVERTIRLEIPSGPDAGNSVQTRVEDYYFEYSDGR